MTAAAFTLQTLHSLPDLPAELRRLLATIPAGCVVSFGDLAEALGDLQAARWVATELQQIDPDELPIHRVIRRTGEIVATDRLSLAERRSRLKREGVSIREDHVDTKLYGCFTSGASAPLRELQAWQERIAEEVALKPLVSLPPRVAGVDVSYATDQRAVAAYTVVETRTGELLHHQLIADDVKFPYITGYLAFRELPLYLKLFAEVQAAGRWEPYLLVDGSGILHPRRCGIATMLGVVAGVNTIGISKHLLYGQVSSGASPAPILGPDGGTLGYRVQQKSKRSTLYISPGHGIDVAGAFKLVQSLLGHHRLAEPIYHADRLSRAAARELKEAF